MINSHQPILPFYNDDPPFHWHTYWSTSINPTLNSECFVSIHQPILPFCNDNPPFHWQKYWSTSINPTFHFRQLCIHHLILPFWVCPDITSMVDWALKTKYLSTHSQKDLSIHQPTYPPILQFRQLPTHLPTHPSTQDSDPIHLSKNQSTHFAEVHQGMKSVHTPLGMQWTVQSLLVAVHSCTDLKR